MDYLCLPHYPQWSSFSYNGDMGNEVETDTGDMAMEVIVIIIHEILLHYILMQ